MALAAFGRRGGAVARDMRRDLGEEIEFEEARKARGEEGMEVVRSGAMAFLACLGVGAWA